MKTILVIILVLAVIAGGVWVATKYFGLFSDADKDGIPDEVEDIVEDVTNADTPNINQIDIPVQSNERVDIRIKSISEVGWPESPVESDWSEIITIDFPDDLKIMAQVNYVDSVSSWRNVSDLITVNNSQEYCDQTFHGAYLKLNNDNI